jgi:hypothetical protein
MDYSSSSDIDSDWEKKLEEMAVAIFLNKSTSNRKLWVHPINAERKEKGVFFKPISSVKKRSRKVSSVLLNVTGAVYLHDLIKDFIKKQNTQFWEAIPSEQRLAVCLR